MGVFGKLIFKKRESSESECVYLTLMNVRNKPSTNLLFEMCSQTTVIIVNFNVCFIPVYDCYCI